MSDMTKPTEDNPADKIDMGPNQTMPEGQPGQAAAPGGEPVAAPGEQPDGRPVPPPGTKEGGYEDGPPAYQEQPKK
ncbi:MAG TPA: hypothetical protein VHL53_01955 [Acidimicrobiia bacterium]|nr:hypothetical protein [Acidimicrobiia bacterium]